MITAPFAFETDFAIQGAGPVGLILAIALAEQGYQVTLIEKLPALASLTEQQKNQTSFDGRVLALTLGSVQFLETLGLSEALAPYITLIKQVHVSQKGYMGVTQLFAEEMGVPYLGVSIQAADLGQVLWQKVLAMPEIVLIQPAEILDLAETEERVQLTLKTGPLSVDMKVVHAKFLVGCDGTQSHVRKLLHLPLEEKDYQAFAVIAKIETELPHLNASFERFTEQGPVALLPIGTHEHKAVYVCPAAEIEQVKQWNDADFMAHFAAKMGERLGRYVAVSAREAYPLKETYAPQMQQGRAVLMGNAAHTQHPVAAQGLNLGIRDIEQFVSQFALSAMDAEADNWPTHMAAYVAQRQQDHQNTMGLTDGLIQLFQQKSPLIGHLRGMGLMALQTLPSLKKRFGRMTMGLK